MSKAEYNTLHVQFRGYCHDGYYCPLRHTKKHGYDVAIYTPDKAKQQYLVYANSKAAALRSPVLPKRCKAAIVKRTRVFLGPARWAFVIECERPTKRKKRSRATTRRASR